MNKRQIKEAKHQLIYEMCIAYYKYADKRFQAKKSKSNARRWNLARTLLLKYANADLRKQIDEISFNCYEQINETLRKL